jgi:hypothetical protein
MSFRVKNPGGSAVQIVDDYIDITLAAGETQDIELMYPGELWRYTFAAQNVTGGGSLLAAINNGDVVRRDDADTTDIAIANAFDDAIWLWHPTKGQWQAFVGSYGTPSSSNVYVTTDDPRYAASTNVQDVDVITSNGSEDAYARGDHTHQGIHALQVNAGSWRYGNISFVDGTDISITDLGTGSFRFDVHASLTSELEVTAGSGLTLNFSGGKLMMNDVLYSVVAGTIVVTDNSETHVYLDTDGIVKDGPVTPPNAVCMAHVTAVSGVVTFMDSRGFANQNLVWGLDADISTILPDDAADAGTSERHTRADHVHAIAADVPNFIGDLGSGVVTTEGSSTSFARADHGHVWQLVSNFAGLPGSPVDGQTVWAKYGVYNGLFYYDSTRTKWLSLEQLCKHWNSGTNSNANTVDLISNVDDTQQDNDFPNPHTITITGLLGTQANALGSSNSTTFDVGVFNLTTGALTQGVTSVTLSTTGARAIRNMSLNVDVADLTILSARRLKASGTENITRPSLSVWYRVRLA